MICMAVSSLDILNLSHSFKDVCEAHAKSPECLSCTLRLLLEYNLIQANLESVSYTHLTLPTILLV